jgi:hypothetical protein
MAFWACRFMLRNIAADPDSVLVGTERQALRRSKKKLESLLDADSPFVKGAGK